MSWMFPSASQRQRNRNDQFVIFCKRNFLPFAVDLNSRFKRVLDKLFPIFLILNLCDTSFTFYLLTEPALSIAILCNFVFHKFFYKCSRRISFLFLQTSKSYQLN